MSRRVSLPGADELFRTTGGMALQATRRQHNGEEPSGERLRPVPASEGESDPAEASEEPAEAERAARSEHPGQYSQSGQSEHSGRGSGEESAENGEHEHRRRETVPAQSTQSASRQVAAPQAEPPRRKQRAANRRPSGRERHDEKITVYVSAEELMDLEHARLVLRGEHGLAVDRGRIVREAVAVVLADLESRGDASILVRRLRGR